STSLGAAARDLNLTAAHRSIEGVACTACQERSHRLSGQKDGYQFIRCLNCGTTFTSCEAEARPLEELYHNYYELAPFEVEPPSAAWLERLAASFEPFRRSGRWLDLGYGEGGLLAAAEKLDWRCYGTEISPRALHYGTLRGWIVSSDADQDPRFPPEGFDVVTMIEVLEHLQDPQAYLTAALQWLRPGGLLYLTSPNANSLNRLFLGLDWSIFKPPEHVTIWTACGLRTALLRAGFLCSRIRTEGFNPCEVLARLRRE